MSILQELKRRNVFRVAVAYVVAAWVITEVSSLILNIYESPDSVIRIIVALLALGLPFAMVFAWAFEVTPEGIKRESEVDRSRSVTHQTAKRLDLLTIGMVVVAAGLFSADRFLSDQYRDVPVAVVDNGITDRVVWATQQLLEIDRLRDLGDYGSAFALATEVEPLLSEDTSGKDLWAGFSWSSDVKSDPSGTKVFRQPMDAAEDEWEDLGTTPLKTVRFAEGEGYRLRFELEGHRSVELLQTAIRQDDYPGAPRVEPVKLDPVDGLPEEMIRILGFTHDLVDYADYFMDRFEVTNREYERFLAAAGYETQDYWIQNFARDGKAVPWEEAVSEFVDRTGRPGPSTWSGGAYPAGQGDYPVSGVSWYEATAYARFVDKDLPTSTHQKMARRFYDWNSWLIASRSNFDGVGARPVGENRAMTTLGVYDLVGNVREWSWNRVGINARGTGGGAWSDAPYHADRIIPKSPWDRDSTNGLRLVRTFDNDEKLARLQQPDEPLERRDFRKEVPVSDIEFMIYRRMYAYDSLPLNDEVVVVDSFDHWTRERVAFDLPSGERGAALLYIPRNVEPPFETVIFWPGTGTIGNQSVDENYLSAFDFIVRSGRVVVQPIFKGTFDRDDANFSITYDRLWGTPESSKSTWYRDLTIEWLQELSRTIDYLEIREDTNTDRLGFYGFSWGGWIAPIVLVVEEQRIDAAVLNVGGLDDVYQFLPEVDTFNFVTRVRSPVLMINGEYDTDYPFETAQKPMFDLLSTEPEHKKFYVTPAAHYVPRDVLIRETLNWFDLYLGGQSN
jgi:dienelactone hydrolase